MSKITNDSLAHMATVGVKDLTSIIISVRKNRYLT